MAFKTKESEGSKSTKASKKSAKAISIQVLLLPNKFLVLDSVGDLHLLSLSNPVPGSEIPCHMKQLTLNMKVQMLAVLPDISTSNASFIWLFLSFRASQIHLRSIDPTDPYLLYIWYYKGILREKNIFRLGQMGYIYANLTPKPVPDFYCKTEKTHTHALTCPARWDTCNCVVLCNQIVKHFLQSNCRSANCLDIGWTSYCTHDGDLWHGYFCWWKRQKRRRWKANANLRFPLLQILFVDLLNASLCYLFLWMFSLFSVFK